MRRFFEQLTDPRTKQTWAIEALAKILELSKVKTQKSLVADIVKKGKASRGSTHTDLSRQWAAFRDIAQFPVVENDETRLTQEGLQIAKHLLAIENIVLAKQRNASRTLNICGPASLLAQFVFPKLTDFFSRNPKLAADKKKLVTLNNLEIHCFERGTRSAWFSLRDNFADLILIRTSFITEDLSAGERNGLMIANLGQETYSWVVPNGKTLIDLKQGRVPMAKLGGTEGEINKVLRKKAPNINWRIYLTDFSGVLNMLEADNAFGGLMPTYMATNFVEGRKASRHYLAPCGEYPSAKISLVCRKASYKSLPKVTDVFNTLAT